MAAVSSYRDLVVWQKAMSLIEEVYRLSEAFPKQEQCGLTSQLRRASVSIAANLAEGHSRATRKDYNHFVSLSQGSLAEQLLREIFFKRIAVWMLTIRISRKPPMRLYGLILTA